jgi:hypothetical protein
LRQKAEFANWLNRYQSTAAAADYSESDSCRDGGKKRTIIHVETLANSSTVVTISAIDP